MFIYRNIHVYKKDYTSSNGSVEFEFVNEAILNIDVEYTTGNDVYTAESVIKLVREELVRKTVIVNPVDQPLLSKQTMVGIDKGVTPKTR